MKRKLDKQVLAVIAGLRGSGLTGQRRKTLRLVVLGSLAVHAALLLGFGSVVLFRAIRPSAVQFTAPAQWRRFEPQKVKLSNRVVTQQRSSPRPAPLPRLVALNVATLTLPPLRSTPQLVRTSFQPNYHALPGGSMGDGISSGHASGGLSQDHVSLPDWFKIPVKGERIAILVDVSVSMIEDERGGARGFSRVKQRIDEVIRELPEQVLFNVIVFADAVSVWEKELQAATDDRKSTARLFLQPFNTEGNGGLASGNYTASAHGLPASGGTTRLDLALDAALACGADTILVISDGLPRVRRVQTPEQAQAQAVQRSQWQEQHAAELAAYDAEAAAAPNHEERMWIPPTPARPPRTSGLREGEAPDPGSPAIAGHWAVRAAGGPVHARPAPPAADPGWWTLADFEQHLNLLQEALYEPKGRKAPVVHIIGYGIDKQGDAFLKQLAQTHAGKYRRVARVE